MMKTAPHTATHKGRLGLKPAMVGVIMLCFAIPMLLVVWLGGQYFMQNVRSQAHKDILQSTQNAAAMAARNLDAATAASRKASYLTTLNDAWNDYRHTGDEATLYAAVSRFLNEQYKYDEKFRNAIITFRALPDRSIYTYAGTSSYTSVQRYQKYVRDTVLAGSEALGTDFAVLKAQGRLYMVRNLLDENYHAYAVLVMELNDEVLFEGLRNALWATACTVRLGDATLPLMGDACPPPPPGTTPAAPTLVAAGGADATVAGCEKLTAGGALGYTICCDMTPLREQVKSILVTLAALSLLLVPLIGAVILLLYHKVNRPIALLSDASGEIQNGHFGIQIPAEKMGSREFCYLGSSFNAMSGKLQNQFEHIYREELALRDARIMALQSQINPHFLNNTLEMINWEARLAEDVKVSQMLEALSTMLEAAMDRRHRPEIHLSEEMMYVDAYLFIIRERLGKRLTIQKEIAPDTLDCYVPRLILQPVLENAVEHGINPIQKGTITIRSRREGDLLLLEIENDGVTTYDDLMKIQTLLSDDPLPEGTGSGSLGIRNVHQRVRMLYGAGCGLAITLTSTGCTLSRITIKIAPEQG
ncbi:MAG: histidine kinase [Gemmiger sp.]|nr:histidine kinase [Gemmiger sp.]